MRWVESGGGLNLVRVPDCVAVANMPWLYRWPHSYNETLIKATLLNLLPNHSKLPTRGKYNSCDNSEDERLLKRRKLAKVCRHVMGAAD